MSDVADIKAITGFKEYRNDRVLLLEGGEIDGHQIPSTIQFMNVRDLKPYAAFDTQNLINALVELNLVEPKQ